MHEVASTPRKRRHEANRERILAGAMAQVVEGGVEALSINKLAGAVDYTPGALYRYFPSKEALIVALTAEVATAFGAELAERLSRISEDAPLERVVVAALTYRDLAEVAPNRFALISVFMAVPRTLVSEAADLGPGRDAVITALRPFAAAFESAAVAGELSSGSAIDRTISSFCALHGVLLLRKQVHRAPEQLDVDRLYTVTLRALLLGGGADTAAVDAALGGSS